MRPGVPVAAADGRRKAHALRADRHHDRLPFGVAGRRERADAGDGAAGEHRALRARSDG